MANLQEISPEALKRRKYWIDEIIKLSGSFGTDSAKLASELRSEIGAEGPQALRDHLRLCGAIPESYSHDSSEEKLYSKYTDCLISEALISIGLKSVVLDARGDSADVEAVHPSFSMVADGKAFRLSRTAKNQKDFKVQAMDGWRGAMDFALVVCPIYQLPTKASQIYEQAIARNVAILSYSHLATLVSLAESKGPNASAALLHSILQAVATLHPSKESIPYWKAVNACLLTGLAGSEALWHREKLASTESLRTGQLEALTFLAHERKRLMSLSHQEALDELLRSSGVDARMKTIAELTHGKLLEA
jgi:HindIII restriction endonuclease